MFIKKDLRKIPTILAEATKKSKNESTSMNDDASSSSKLIDLPLQRRKSEFRGSVKILCQPSNAPSLCQLQSLSLYDCDISSLQGIGMLESLITLNAGRNPLTHIPDDIASLSNLQKLWLDDCSLEGALPAPILELTQLQELRITNNRLTQLPADISRLTNLQILGLDKNLLTSIPVEIQSLVHLTTLLLRQNALTQLPDLHKLTNLQVLHVSSNQLTILPCLYDGNNSNSSNGSSSLTHIYANSNRLTSLAGMEQLELFQQLKHVTVAHNAIDYVPTDFLRTFGTPDEDGVCRALSNCTIVLRGNPVVQQFVVSSENQGDNGNDDPMEITTEAPLVAT
jgi:Leucine-rich repeat (LRR) protein